MIREAFGVDELLEVFVDPHDSYMLALFLDDVDDEKRDDDDSDDDSGERESDKVRNQGFKSRGEHTAWVKSACNAIVRLVLEECLKV